VPAPDPLERLNRLPAEVAEGELLACCGSESWARRMVADRPFGSAEALVAAADAALAGLAWVDVEQALAAHPRLGGRPAADRHGDAAARWSRAEQAGVTAADGGTRSALAAGNAAYERRFGYIYLACATGRSGAELVALLHDRLGNDPVVEREVVRSELGKITRLRLGRLLTADGGSPAVAPA
jgi:2-oxo-4-hydroxy-4-carboxy-5-ureidoimidazoline decarboxylase